jgi:hypothetical protein
LIESYPLYWPDGWQRTPFAGRKNGRFKTTFAGARDSLLKELQRLGATQVVLSTSVPLRNDGLPMAKAREPEDPGVAVYFYYKKKEMCFACDRFDFVRDNIQAVKLTVEALRGIERWGASDMLDRAFTGFVAIGDGGFDWRTILGFVERNHITLADIERRFRELAKVHHPDIGGDTERFKQINLARDAARAEVGA